MYLHYKEGYRLIRFDKNQHEETVIEIDPDSGGRDTVSHGISKALAYLSNIEEIHYLDGERETLSQLTELGRFLFALQYAIILNTEQEKGR